MTGTEAMPMVISPLTFALFEGTPVCCVHWICCWGEWPNRVSMQIWAGTASTRTRRKTSRGVTSKAAASFRTRAARTGPTTAPRTEASRCALRILQPPPACVLSRQRLIRRRRLPALRTDIRSVLASRVRRPLQVATGIEVSTSRLSICICFSFRRFHFGA
jgi:hypothetical protein